VGRRPTFCFKERLDALFDTTTIESLIAPALDTMGYRIVRVVFTGGRRPTLQVMAERRDEAAMTVDDCASVSHTISAILDVADPIDSSYDLEVSSPGIDRPLVRPEDYERFSGFEAKLELSAPHDGRRRFRGRLRGREGDAVKLDLGASEVLLPLSAIAKARLILTDELIAATNPQHRS
jgi:ribosome maturation factor RimP